MPENAAKMAPDLSASLGFMVCSISKAEVDVNDPGIFESYLCAGARRSKTFFCGLNTSTQAFALRLMQCVADATQIEQALLNLAANSMQAAPGGPQCIDIRLDTVMLDASFANEHHALRSMHFSHPALTLRLTLSDSGPGMDAATLARIFEAERSVCLQGHGWRDKTGGIGIAVRLRAQTIVAGLRGIRSSGKRSIRICPPASKRLEQSDRRLQPRKADL
ncbi:MAG: hypothetical protein ACTS6J_06580 [Burkholderiales bacterium]